MRKEGGFNNCPTMFGLGEEREISSYITGTNIGLRAMCLSGFRDEQSCTFINRNQSNGS